MRLSYTDFGGHGRPLIILHGLFASSKNWSGIGKFLTGYCHPYALDLRNHGDSPHHPSHTLAELIGDLEDWIGEQISEQPILLGHSMGGLTAMGYSLYHPEDVQALAVIDIAPKAYAVDHTRELEALRLDISFCRSRGEIDEIMAPLIPQIEVRRFLQMNAERTEHGFRWKIDAEVLQKSTVNTDFSTLSGAFGGKTLFIAGSESDYVGPENYPQIRSFFPQAKIHIIPGAGHWLHHTAAGQFKEALVDFIENLD